MVKKRIEISIDQEILYEIDIYVLNHKRQENNSKINRSSVIERICNDFIRNNKDKS
jgi:metal-responsive CopG/Arc/MetJ family transcriptional regulator